MSDSTVSIIVPVYNAEKCLCRCIESIIAQTYTNLEIILVDDGSPDRCPSICDEYASKDSRIKVIHQKNGGVSVARNTGLDMATGEYISFVDSDDTIERDFLEKLMTAFDDDIDIVSGLAIWISNETEEIEYYEALENIVTFDINYDFNLRNAFNLYTVWGKIYKRKILQNLRFDLALFNGEDSLFNCQAIINSKKIKYIPEHLYNYVIYNTSLSHGKLNLKNLSAINAMSKIFDIYSGYVNSTSYIASDYFEVCIGIYKRCILDCDDKKKIKPIIIDIISSQKSDYIFSKANLSSRNKLKLFLIKNCSTLYDLILYTKHFLGIC